MCNYRICTSMFYPTVVDVGGFLETRMEMRQIMVHDVLDVIPRLHRLRRVPRQYWYCLPLQVMKRHQCIVIGGEPGILTVAVADGRRTHIFTYLRLLTGCAIF